MIGLDRKVRVAICAGVGLLLALAVFPVMRAYAGGCVRSRNCQHRDSCGSCGKYEVWPIDSVCDDVATGADSCSGSTVSGTKKLYESGSCDPDSSDRDCDGTDDDLCFGGTFVQNQPGSVSYTFLRDVGSCP